MVPKQIATTTPDPRRRLSFMIEDSTARVLVTAAARQTRNLVSVPSRTAVIEIDELLEDDGNAGKKSELDLTADDAAYLIYTLGSTGQRKSVQVTHANLAN